MVFPEWLPLFITAVLGSTGATAALAKLTQLSGPARLRKRVQATAALAKELPPGPAKTALDLAVDRDSATLASMSLVKPSRGADLMSVIIYLLICGVTLSALVLYVIINLKEGEWLSEYKDDVLATGIPALISATMFYVIVIASISVYLNKQLKDRRNHYANSLFAQTAIDSEREKQILISEHAKGSSTRPRRGTASGPQG